MPTFEQPIQDFYAAFNRRDGAAMAACYAPDVKFSDPVFPELHGEEAGAMWRMLTAQATDLTVELLDVHQHGDHAHANWRAHYTFSRTGRPVVNEVTATFFLSDGLIAEHIDDFSFYRWSRQALGAPGWLLGWTPMLKRKVQAQAAASLSKFRAESSS
jgi:ketosteroid isomerase-like protein